jgi:hypothetical protein
MTIVELRKALTRFKQTHNNELPAEPLHFTLDQWREFLLEERLKVIEVCKPDGTPQKSVFGMRVVLHPDMKALKAAKAQDSSPELWT